MKKNQTLNRLGTERNFLKPIPNITLNGERMTACLPTIRTKQEHTL